MTMKAKPMMTKYDTTNKFLVSSTVGGVIRLLNPPAPQQGMTQDEAFVLAAYLVALSGHEVEDLNEVLEQLG
jgi:hypothetical protein